MATIEKRGGSYRIKVSCGYGLDGKQLVKSITWKPQENLTAKQIEKELKRQAVLFEEKCKTGQFIDGNIRFAEFAERWFTDYAEKQLKKKTIARYKSMMKRINSAIGNIKLDKLQPHHLLEFYSSLEEDGIREDTKYKPCVDFKQKFKELGLTKTRLSQSTSISIGVLNSCTLGKNVSRKSAEAICKALNCPIEDLFTKCEGSKLSSKTINHHHRLISSILSTAVQWQILFSNPCERVKPPKIERKEAKYLDDKETAKLLELLEDAPFMYQVIIQLFLYTGFRRGELCGLEWNDVDFNNNTITVKRSSLYLPSEGIYDDTTKNYSSQRIIKVSVAAMELLKAHKRQQNITRLEIGDAWEDHNKLFTQWNGRPIHPDSISNWFASFIEKNNLPKVSLHSLRHPYVKPRLKNKKPSQILLLRWPSSYY